MHPRMYYPFCYLLFVHQASLFHKDSHFAPTQPTYWEFFIAVNEYAVSKIKFPVFLWPTNMVQIPLSILIRDR